MISTSDFKNGISIIINDVLYQIVEFQHIKPGKGGAFVRTKLKNMQNRAVLDMTFRAGEKLEQAYIENKKIQYLYHSDDKYYFMDTESFEEVAISQDTIGENKNFLLDGMVISSLWYKNTIIDITLPTFVVLKIEQTEPGVKGDTAKASSKPATTNTGAIIQVPLFVNTGDSIKIDTRTGEYVERA